jgi:TP901 family phage tail tape measure protein
MLNSLGLGFVISAHDLASGKFAEIERSFMSLDRKVGLGADRIGGSFRTLGTGLAVMTAGVAMVGGAFALADKAGQFEQAIAAVGAVSGATKSELTQLHDAAIEAGIATQFTPTEATVGLRELAQAGFNAHESIQLLIPVLDLAGGSLGELSPAQAAGLASQALKAFGISADDAGVAVDRMLQSVNLFALNAAELPMALGNASRGAQALHQSMSETLITLGLVKNIIPGVERASTGVAVAMERLADPRTQRALEGIGVSATDSQGHFRNFLDVLSDMTPALDRMTDAKRSAFLIDTFGAHALGSVQAVMTQVTHGIRTNTGETVKGAAALAYLRGQFENAGGTAATFRDKLLDTFAGQKQLLRGSLETLAITLGEPFARAFKPILAATIEALNGFLRFVRAMPTGVKDALASFVVGAGAVMTVVGAAIAAKASLGLLSIALRVAGISFAGIASAAAPAIVVVAAFAIAIAGLHLAFERNLGGLGDLARGAWARVSLAFEGLKQLFEEGGFSGAVREELGRVESGGLKGFLINVFLWANRIRTFFGGIATGFSAGVDAARPTIDGFVGALRSLGAALGFIADRDDATVASAKYRAFGAAGVKVGAVLGKAFELVVQGMTVLVQIGRGLAEGWVLIQPAAMSLWGSLVRVFAALGDVVTMLAKATGMSNDGGSAWSAFGNVVAFVVTVIVDGLALLGGALAAAAAVASAAVGAVMSLFSDLADVITGVVFIIGGIIDGDWKAVWTGMKLIAFGIIDAIIGVVLELVGAIGGAVDAMAGMVGKTTGIQKAVRDYKDGVHRDLATSFGVESLTYAGVKPIGPPATIAAPPSAVTAMPAVAAISSSAGPVMMTPVAPPPARGPLVVNVQVDGQTVARAVHKADSDAAARSFSPVPAY